MEPGIHHVYARGNNREAIFRSDEDRREYLRRLASKIVELRWACLAYCLMTNHVHLVVETTEPNLERGIRQTHGPYAQAFNRRYARTGHLFENRFGSVRVEDDAHLWMELGYVGRNPTEAEMCPAPADWPWSSYGDVVNGTTPPWLDVTRLLELVGGTTGARDPLQAYVECVEPGQAVAVVRSRSTAARTASRASAGSRIAASPASFRISRTSQSAPL